MPSKSIVLLFFFPVLATVSTDICAPTNCSDYGPTIQFPFRLKDRQPQHCGYDPAFDLYCNQLNETVFQLPNHPVEFVVSDISYIDQKLDLVRRQRCYPPQGQPLFLNLSASPFLQYKNLLEYILFNCSASDKYTYFSNLCFDESSYQLYAFTSDDLIPSFRLVSCTKLYKFSSVGRLDGDLLYVSLNWFKPACGRCVSRGKICSLNTNSSTRGHDELLCNNEPIKTNKGVLKRLLVSGEILGSFIFLVALTFLYHLYNSIREHKRHQAKIETFLDDYKALKPTRFSYAETKKITNQFTERLGEGGYGVVYKGKLSTDIHVAVKVLNNSQGNGEEFVNEVAALGRIHHVNVVRLVGYCADGFRRALVYEFLPNGSLEKVIFRDGPKRSSLNPKNIQDIALGIAKGIEYLHQGCEQQILHFDIKPNNILLDYNFNPKICDFGLAKLCSKEQSAVSMTVARGTMGYIAPEVLSRTYGRASYKSDVYSFGMLLLEMVGGRKNMDLSTNDNHAYLPQWIYNHLDQGEEILVHIEDQSDETKIVTRKLAIIGLWCIQWHPADRPSMKAVLQMLEGDGSTLIMPPNPFPTTNAKKRCGTELELILELE